ncbi:MAG: PilZ domain-containing protein [Ignavibacteria bacterium]|nr:PilZ domain-containing protein [Ignavibacteria bacterium]
MKEKRAYKRKTVNIQATIVYNDEMYSGTVTNLSKNGVYIETGLRFPLKLKYKIFFRFKPKFIIFIRSNGNSLKVPVKTRRWFKIDRYCNGIGVEIPNPSQDYYKLINRH